MRGLTIATLVCLLTAASSPANGQPHAYGPDDIRRACSRPVAVDIPREAIDYLHDSANAVVSLPKLSCIALLFDKEFASTWDRTITQSQAEDGSYAVIASNRLLRPDEEPHYALQQIPFDGSRWVPGVGIGVVRWEFESPEYRIEEGATLTFRKYQSISAGTSNALTIRVVRAFPILDNGVVVERLFLVRVDEVPSEAARRPSARWVLYSERANMVIHLFLTMFTKGHRGPPALGRVERIVYFDQDRMDLTIEKDQLQDLLAFAQEYVADDR